MTLQLALLVFFGVAVATALVLSTVWRTLRERAAESAEGETEAVSPLRRFVTPVRLAALKLTFCLVPALAAVVVLVGAGYVSPVPLLLAGCLLGGVGWNLPMLYFRMKIQKRRERFNGQILQLTMSLSNGLRSGQALLQALDAASQRLDAPMREELAVVLGETRLGFDLTDALERFYSRMPGEDLRLLVTSIKLTLQTGGSLAEVLERMVETIRARVEFQERLKNMTAQGRFEAIAMSLAPVLVYVLLRLIDPDLMIPLTSTLVGWCTIGIVTAWVLIGFFVINKIVTIEV